ncbi:P-loop containing nucleoside triphosphate hydrolase protein [Powellomyces hirtus]|nr:P-loop containing nucleoside triphosphate hydrolase protein [Powellomyces hirtus]
MTLISETDTAEMPQFLLGKPQKGPPSVSLIGLWRYADGLDMLMVSFAVLAGMINGFVNPVVQSRVALAILSSLQKEKSLEDATKIWGSLAVVHLSLRTAERQAKRISLLYLERLLRQEMAWLDTISKGLRSSEAVSSDVQAQDQALSSCLTNDDVHLVKLGIGEDATPTAPMLPFVSFFPALPSRLALMPLLIGAAYVLVKIETVMLGRASHALGQATPVADQALAGIRTYDEKLQEVSNADARKGKAAGFAAGLFQAIIFLIFAFSFWYATRAAINIEISGSDAAIAILAMMIVALLLMGVLDALLVPAKAQSAARVVYPARPDIQILNGLSPEVKSGQTVALVGYTINEYNSLAKPDWIVGIKQNILLGLGGLDNVPPARFIAVCKMAQCHDFICIFPLGYETPVTQGVLSWGQKQRIAIACALIKEVKILLLDEATSALDSKAERLVQRALDAAARGRTTIVTAHRLSTVRNADVIYVMNSGQVIEQGNHKELLARNGVYTSLVDKQKLSGHKEDSKSSVVERGIESADAPDAVMNDQVRRMMQESVLVMDSPEVIAKQTQLRLKEDKLRQQSENDSASSRIVRSAEMMTTEGWSVAGGTIAAGIGGLAFPGFAIVLGLVIGKISKEETADTYIAMKGEELIFSGHPLIWVPRDCSPPSFAFPPLLFSLPSSVFLAFLGFFSTWAKIAAFGKVDARLTSRLRLAVFQNWMRQEMGFFDRKENASSCRIASRMSGGSVAQLGMLDCVYRCLLFLTFLPGFDGYPSSSGAVHSPAASKRTPQPAFAAKSAEATEQAASVAGEAVRDPQSTTAMLVLCIGSLAGKSLYERGEIDISNVRRPFVRKMLKTITATLGMMTTMISVASAAAATTGYSKGRFAAKMTFLLHDRKSDIDPDKGGHMPGWPSGCGKSTIIGLLQRWYGASGGDATIDHIPIRNYAVMKGLGSNMALVGQHHRKHCMGSEVPVTRDEVIEAAKQADVHTFTSALPQGYDIRVGAKRCHLPGGRKQRITITHVRNPEPAFVHAVVMTDPDSTAEAEIQKAIDKAAVGRTTVTIAHRLFLTMKNVDHIAAVNEGKIVEYGTHSELSTLNGIFAEICRQQNF